MKLFKLITKRNKDTMKNQEFQVRDCDDFNDGKFRGYSQQPEILLEFDIISKIENGEDFRTRNIDGTYTKCEVGERNGVKYLTSKPNNSMIDNIINLPKY